MIYLATPIDRADIERIAPVKALVYYSLMSRSPGEVVYNPSAAFMVKPDSVILDADVQAIVQINAQALIACRMLVCLYVPGTESWGMPMELRMAYDRGIPICVYGVDVQLQYDRLPVYLRSVLPAEQFVKHVDDLLARVGGA